MHKRFLLVKLRAKIAGFAAEAACVFRVRPLCPDVYAARAQVPLVRVAGEKPEEFLGDPAKGNFLRRDDGETGAQVEARLVAEV